jgi:hypothetical protein
VTVPDLEYEVGQLLRKVRESEDFVQRAEAYFQEHQFDMSEEIAGRFLDTLERKKDQIHYEWWVIGQMGDAIAAGRENWFTGNSPDL